MKQTTKFQIWKSLEDHARSLNAYLPAHLLQDSIIESEQFNVAACNINIDYSNQRITEQTLQLLFSLAKQSHVVEKIEALFCGHIVNQSENKPALHTALRAPEDKPIFVDGINIMEKIAATRTRMKTISDQIREKKWLGFTGKPVTDIVNIGIGGSDLGPHFFLNALEEYTLADLSYHFISDADPISFQRVIKKLKPETTLFIVSSKSFTTHETLLNARKAMAWIGETSRHMQHFIAITANIEKAQQFGINTILPIWSWIGGRFSSCSAINLITAIAIGFEQFTQVLAGAHSMDLNFQQKDFRTNLPVLLALIGIWNNNFLNIHNLLLLVYAKQLENFPPYIQQLDMESNGKSIDNQGNSVNYATSPIIWGGLGNQAQHSYYQLLCQGTHKTSIDFILLKNNEGNLINEMCAARAKVLSNGVNDQTNPNGFIPGSIPLNLIRIDEYSPFTLGALIALYEHKIYVQSIIWNINPFDQPGVESTKQNEHLQKENNLVLEGMNNYS